MIPRILQPPSTSRITAFTLLTQPRYRLQRNNRQRVITHRATPDWLPVYTGIRQGSTLGPIHFFLYIADLSSTSSIGTYVALYTDDAKAFCTIVTKQVRYTPQADL